MTKFIYSHADGTRGVCKGFTFYVRFSVSVCFFLAISQKPLTELDVNMLHDES